MQEETAVFSDLSEDLSQVDNGSHGDSSSSNLAPFTWLKEAAKAKAYQESTYDDARSIRIRRLPRNIIVSQ